MPYRAPSEASTNGALRTLSSGIAACAIVLGLVSAALLAFDVATRPPCRPGYVRLVDMEPAGPFLALGLVAIAVVLLWRSRRGTHLLVLMALGIAVLSLAGFFTVAAVATVVHHHGARYDSGCWTF